VANVIHDALLAVTALRCDFCRVCIYFLKVVIVSKISRSGRVISLCPVLLLRVFLVKVFFFVIVVSVRNVAQQLANIILLSSVLIFNVEGGVIQCVVISLDSNLYTFICSEVLVCHIVSLGQALIIGAIDLL